MSNEKNVRHRFTVPSIDTVVNDWIENQSNLGFSLRVLIRAFVRQYGVDVDATCVEFGTPAPARRGRPPKNRSIQLDNMMLTDDEVNTTDTADAVVETKVEVPNQPAPQPVVQPTPQPVATPVPQPVQQSVAKEEPVVTETKVQTNQAPSSNIMDILNIGVPTNNIPAGDDTPSQASDVAESDDDGFIDPDTLF